MSRKMTLAARVNEVTLATIRVSPTRVTKIRSFYVKVCSYLVCSYLSLLDTTVTETIFFFNFYSHYGSGEILKHEDLSILLHEKTKYCDCVL